MFYNQNLTVFVNIMLTDVVLMLREVNEKWGVVEQCPSLAKGWPWSWSSVSVNLIVLRFVWMICVLLMDLNVLFIYLLCDL